MANDLSTLVPDAYAALNVVGRELVGFIPAISYSAELTRAAVGQVVQIPIAGSPTGENIVPAATPPDTGDLAHSSVPLSITKSRAWPFRYYGEEDRGLSFGPGRLNLQQQSLAQAFRAACNEIEADIWATYVSASRAVGTAGTAPFASNINILNSARKILVDNGCPQSDLQFVMNTTAGMNMRNITHLQKVNESGDSGLLRQGILENLSGFDIRESAQVSAHTIGSANGAYVTNGTFAVGDTAIDIDTGAGTILAGDILTFTGDPNLYVVKTALAGGTVTIANPGLRQTLADGVGVTLTAAYTANLAFHRNAIVAGVRAPALPKEGDSAADRIMVTDAYSGLMFELAMYKEYRRIRYEVAVAWGVGNIKSEHTCTILG